jgi:hypothetical protein
MLLASATVPIWKHLPMFTMVIPSVDTKTDNPTYLFRKMNMTTLYEALQMGPLPLNKGSQKCKTTLYTVGNWTNKIFVTDKAGQKGSEPVVSHTVLHAQKLHTLSTAMHHHNSRVTSSQNCIKVHDAYRVLLKASSYPRLKEDGRSYGRPCPSAKARIAPFPPWYPDGKPQRTNT